MAWDGQLWEASTTDKQVSSSAGIGYRTCIRMKSAARGPELDCDVASRDEQQGLRIQTVQGIQSGDAYVLFTCDVACRVENLRINSRNLLSLSTAGIRISSLCACSSLASRIAAR